MRTGWASAAVLSALCLNLACKREQAAPRPIAEPVADAAPIAPELTLSEHGPHIHWKQTLAGTPFAMSPAGDRYWTTDDLPGGGEKLVAHELAPEDRATEILRVPGRLEGPGTVRCAADLCAAESAWTDGRPPSGFFFNPRKIFLFDQKTKVRTEVKGPWGTAGGFASVAAGGDGAAIAPGGEFIILEELRMKPKPPNQAVLYVVTRSGKVTGPVDLGDAYWEVRSVTATSILLSLDASHEKNPTLSYVNVDPATGKVTPAEAPKAPYKDITSPDGKRTAECKDGALVLRELATGTERRFPLREGGPTGLDTLRPAPFGARSPCVAWASNRYLWFETSFVGFVDLDTMNVNKAFSGNDRAVAITLDFDKDFAHVVGGSESGARVGQIAIE